MNNPLTLELAQLRQRELQQAAQALRQNAVTQSQNPLSSTLNTLFQALTHRAPQESVHQVDETAHLAWLADQA